MRWTIAALSLLLAAAPAEARDLRDYCPDRPGIGTPPCTIDRGHISIEGGLIDWTREGDPVTRTDTYSAGDVLLRYGLSDSLELRAEWGGIGHVRARDRLTGARSRTTRAGDVSLGLRQNLANPDGSGFSIALLPVVTLPVGRQPVGAGDWAASLLVPASYELNDTLSLAFTGEVDAAVDEDGDGRHLAYSGVIGLAAKVSEAVSATLEYQMARDRDPGGHSTQHLAGLSLGWMARDDLQLDLGANAGLDRDAPDAEVYVGVSKRF